MRRPDARWTHAAKVALAATAVVGVVTLLLAIGVNSLIERNLTRDIDSRLAATLVAMASAAPGSVAPTHVHHGGDVDDVPDFVWRVASDGQVTALTVGAPLLPTYAWSTSAVTLPAEGVNFRFVPVPSGGGWLVAGESVIRAHDARNDLLAVEGVLGALLLVVTFIGSFIVGLRASAPIEQIRRRQAEFTADASHELRTPLSVIEAEVELSLSRARDSDEYQATLERIGSESMRLRAIVDDLLWLARADGRALDRGQAGYVDVSAAVVIAADRFQAVADTGSFTLTTHTPPEGAAQVRGDEEGIDRLVTVLVDNACKYAGAGGAVEVGVSASGGRVVLTVDDSGPGIPEDARDLVFDRFHRADQSPGGTGLGLAIADAVVRATSGTWSVSDSPAGGARFEVIWRLATRAPTLPKEPPVPADQLPDPSLIGP
ncbi:MAG TPA: HAMP domain-containing sensor histidine kinase [Acidimicrobiales bacterium]